MWPDPTSLILFMTATLALNLTPGPDMLYVIARSSSEGTRAGIVSALGIATGSLFHLAMIVLGLASLLEAVPAAYDVIRYAGGGYLVYLGVRVLRGSARNHGPVVTRDPIGRIYRQGVITNVLNPKVALFFAAFLPQFADASRGSVVGQLIVLGLLFNLSGTTVNAAVAVAAGRLGTAMRDRVRNAAVMRWVTGSVFIGLGLRLALARRN